MSDNEMLKLFPLQYQDGPDYCEVKDANGASFALTMRPDVMKAMEFALRAAASAEPVAITPLVKALNKILTVADDTPATEGQLDQIHEIASLALIAYGSGIIE